MDKPAPSQPVATLDSALAQLAKEEQEEPTDISVIDYIRSIFGAMTEEEAELVAGTFTLGLTLALKDEDGEMKILGAFLRGVAFGRRFEQLENQRKDSGPDRPE